MFKKTIKFLFKLSTKRTKILFIGSVIFTIIHSVAELFSVAIIIPLITVLIDNNSFKDGSFIKKTFDYLNFDSEYDFKLMLVIVTFILILSTVLIKIFTTWYNNKFSAHIGRIISNSFVKKILDVKYAHLIKVNLDEYLTIISKNIEYITFYIILPFINIISSSAQIILMISVLVFINPSITILTSLFFIGIYLIISFISRKKLHQISHSINSAQPEIVRGMREMISGFKEIYLYSRRDNYENFFSRKFLDFFNASSYSLFIAALPKYILESIAMGFLIIVLFVQLIGNSNIILIIPFLTAFILALQKLLPSFQIIFVSYASIRSRLDLLNSTIDTFNSLDKNKSILKNKKIKKFTFKSITFENVSFGYDNQKMAISSLSHQVNIGDRVLLYGPSGSGKSTFVDLFCGFLTQKDGKILINNRFTIKEADFYWRSCISYIPQKINILNGSFYENIAYSKEAKNINKSLVKKYAKLVGLHDLVMSKELDYNSIINSDINSLSGGQMKRIAIARALYYNKSIIIFDEATSGLDENSELEIVNTLLSFPKNKTFIIISHNPKLKSYFQKVLEFKF